MGQGIFISALGEVRFPRSWLASVLNHGSSQPGDLQPGEITTADYADGFAEIYCHFGEEGDISTVSLLKFGGPTALDRIFEIMDKIPSYALWTEVPAGEIGAVTKRRYLSMLPADYFLDRPPVVAGDVRKLTALIGRDYETERVVKIMCGR